MRLLLLILGSFCFVSIVGAKEVSANDFACTSYGAVYKPHSNYKNPLNYKLTIQNIPQPDGWKIPQYENIKVIKFDDSQNPVYELNLKYSCGGGSAPQCSVGAGTTTGKPITIIPSALNQDFSSSFFIVRNFQSRTIRMPPYALIFSGAASEFYYKGPYLSESALKYFNEDKKPVYSFPEVWILEGCQESD